MSAPRFVPRAKSEGARAYESPPVRTWSWTGSRPGELRGPRQPGGQLLGNQGPDQGYALRLCRQFEGRLTLAPNEWEDDALAGASAVAMKRASLLGRGPTAHDLRLALTLFGYLGSAPTDLVGLRQRLFEGVANPHHYTERRHIADIVPAETLRLSHDEVAERAQSAWRTLFVDLPEPGSPHGAPASRAPGKAPVPSRADDPPPEPQVSPGEHPEPGEERSGQETGSMFGRSSDVGERRKKSPSHALRRLQKNS